MAAHARLTSIFGRKLSGIVQFDKRAIFYPTLVPPSVPLEGNNFPRLSVPVF